MERVGESMISQRRLEIITGGTTRVEPLHIVPDHMKHDPAYNSLRFTRKASQPFYFSNLIESRFLDGVPPFMESATLHAVLQFFDTAECAFPAHLFASTHQFITPYRSPGNQCRLN